MPRAAVFARSVPGTHTFFLKLILLLCGTRSDVSQGGLELAVQLRVTSAGMLHSPFKDNYSLKISHVCIVYFDRSHTLPLLVNPFCLPTQQVLLLVLYLFLPPNEFD